MADVSARDMSLSIGLADNYINHIENKKSMPSFASFELICEYFKISPLEFFDDGNRYPVRLQALFAKMMLLDESTLTNFEGLVDTIVDGKSAAK